MKKYRCLMFLLALVLISCDESGPSQKEEPPPEGPGGGISACTGDENCPAGQICKDGACIQPSIAAACSNDGECQAGQYCSNGSCVAKEEQPPVVTGGGTSACTSDENCPSGQKCENGTCVAKPPSCLVGEIFIDGACKRYGMLNMPCKDGEVCDPGLGCNVDNICLGREEWTHLGKPMVFPAFASGAVARLGNVTYVGTLSGVFKTGDGGSTWLPVNNGLPGSSQVTALITVGQNIYAGLFGEGVYVTSDGGLNWNSINTGLSPLGRFVTSIVKATTKAGLFYIGTREGVFFASGPTPTEWKNMGLKELLVTRLAYYNSKLYALAIDTAAWKQKGVFVYESKGNWLEVNDGLKDPETGVLKPIHSITVSSSLGLIVAAQDGIYKWKLSAKQGGMWVPAIEIDTPSLILTTVGDEIYIAASGGAIYKYTDGKLAMIGIKDKPSFNSVTPVDDKIFVVTSKGIYKTNKDNINWEFTGYDIGYDYIMESILVNNTLVAGTDSRGLAYSSNGGASWTYLQLADKYNNIVGIKQNNNMTYAVSAHVLQSADGINWQPITNDTLFKPHDFIFFDNKMFIASDKEVLEYIGSKTGGKLGTLPSEVISLGVFKGEMYAGTMKGLYKLVDGNKWAEAGLQDEIVTVIFPHENDLYAGSFSGIYRLSLTDAGLQPQPPKLGGFKIADIKAFGDHIYAATNLGLCKATKGDDDWSYVKEFSDVGFVTSLFATKEMLFAGTMGLGLYVLVP